MAFGSGGSGCERLVEALPVPRPELVKAGLRDRGDAREEIGLPGVKIDVVELGRHDEREHDGGAFGTTV